MVDRTTQSLGATSRSTCMQNDPYASFRMKILIADDTPTNVKQLEVVAQKLGHQTITANDSVEAPKTSSWPPS